MTGYFQIIIIRLEKNLQLKITDYKLLKNSNIGSLKMFMLQSQKIFDD